MVQQQRQIIALGGGGFPIESENLSLERFILEQAHVPNPAVCLLPTARGDADSYVVRFYDAFSKLACRPSHISLFQRTPDLRSYIFHQDVIYVGGGNTKSMLGVWREWGIPELLKEAYESGIVLAGTSAGAICWFGQGVTDSFADKLSVLDCLGFLQGSCCPHYDSEPERKPAYHNLLLNGEIYPGIAIDNSVAVHFLEGEISQIVASRPEGQAYLVRAINGTVMEDPFAVEYIGVP